MLEIVSYFYIDIGFDEFPLVLVVGQLFNIILPVIININININIVTKIIICDIYIILPLNYDVLLFVKCTQKEQKVLLCKLKQFIEFCGQVNRYERLLAF